MTAPTTPTRVERFAAPLAFAAAFAAVVLATNLLVARLHRPLDLPDYAPWSGVMEIEIKLRLLERFAREGPVDAVVVSSSLGDYGVSAETLTRELSTRYGRPFRVFNFSLGGSDIPTYPVIYRLARLEAKPKEVWVAAPVSRVPPDGGNAFDRHLLAGPFSRYDRLPGLLEVSHAAYEIPLLRFAPAIRDILIHADFPNRPRGGHDAYPMSAHGDTVSSQHVANQYALAPKLVADRRREVLGFENGDASERERYIEPYFNRRAVQGIQRLRDEAARDDARIVVVALDYATAMTGRDPAFARGEARYFERLAREYGATVVNAMPDFKPDAYMIQDRIHLNAFGAREFSTAIAARLTGGAAPVAERFKAPSIAANENGWTGFSALIPKRALDPAASLEIQMMQNRGVAKLRPYAEMAVQVRMPDGREFFAPARIMNATTVLADSSHIPFTQENEIVYAQIVAGRENWRVPLDIPMGAFHWSSQTHPPEFYAAGAHARIGSELATYRGGERIRVAWQDVESPSVRDWIGVFAENAPDKPLDRGATRGAASGHLQLIAMPPGRYVLRLLDGNVRQVLAASEPFEVR